MVLKKQHNSIGVESQRSFLSVEGVSVCLVSKGNSTEILNGVELDVNRGDILCLLGPSGCGKTTLLRTVAGFQQINQGRIVLDGEVVSGIQRMIPPEKRNIGVVFQDFALFPHLTVKQNIEFGIRGKSGKHKRDRIEHLLTLIDMIECRYRYPHELSGGQQQRVALARALAPSPKLILLDEPFSAIDVEFREALAAQTRAILKQEKVTAIMVSHDQQEAFALADKIAVMAKGRILQVGNYNAIYGEPVDPFVAEFVGESGWLKGKAKGGQIETALGPVSAINPIELPDHQEYKVLVRPHDLIFDPNSTLKGRLTNSAFRGSHLRYQIELPTDEKLKLLVDFQQQHTVGDDIGLRLTDRPLPIFLSNGVLP